MLVRGFADSNADGTGDLQGLIGKLDYLQWLGVDCLWLPPFFDSPLRDGGYDVSDYTNVLPEFGTIGDFLEMVEAAHARGIRVIIDMVMNHTSDAHPWFQSSRNDPTGPFGDFYMWADDDDPVRRRADHLRRHRGLELDLRPGAQAVLLPPLLQPPAGPELRQPRGPGRDARGAAILARPRRRRLPARRGALPVRARRAPTARTCRRRTTSSSGCRAEVDRLYPDAVLLCEANQWPQDVVEYFGDDDECQMAFHFPVMPRLFMAVRRESRLPITEILAQTPAIPDRLPVGHLPAQPRRADARDGVSDEERDYMWAEYAADPRMKANIGIRRRLAPLLDNSRDQIELFTGLLLSLPGSPVLYYGDEIGMGDNIYLGDRDGVRTPMQWTPDRNAGFSTADPQRIYLPLILDPVYGYQSLNIEAQQRNPSISAAVDAAHDRRPQAAPGLRARHLHRSCRRTNPSVLAYVREFGDDRVLCVAEPLPLRPAGGARPRPPSRA